MADPPPASELRGDPGGDVGTPRWVYGFGIGALVLILLVAIQMLTGGGDHGPDRHLPSGATPAATFTDHSRP